MSVCCCIVGWVGAGVGGDVEETRGREGVGVARSFSLDGAMRFSRMAVGFTPRLETSEDTVRFFHEGVGSFYASEMQGNSMLSEKTAAIGCRTGRGRSAERYTGLGCSAANAWEMRKTNRRMKMEGVNPN